MEHNSKPTINRIRTLYEASNRLIIEEKEILTRIDEYQALKLRSIAHIQTLREKTRDKAEGRLEVTQGLVKSLLDPEDDPNGGLMKYEPRLVDPPVTSHEGESDKIVQEKNRKNKLLSSRSVSYKTIGYITLTVI